MHVSIQKSGDRGAIHHGWLETKHSFSFGSYYNPLQVGFGALKVLNDDTIHKGRGFDDHSHENMEIITIVLSGELRHGDNTGSTAVLGKGDVQIMSAGTGIIHSEYNNSHEEPVSLLQLWISPREEDLWPRHEEKHFEESVWKEKFYTLVSPADSPSSLKAHQDTWISRGTFSAGKEFSYTLNNKEHGVYLFVINGEIEISGQMLSARDSAEIIETESIVGKALSAADILLIEVPF